MPSRSAFDRHSELARARRTHAAEDRRPRSFDRAAMWRLLGTLAPGSLLPRELGFCSILGERHDDCAHRGLAQVRLLPPSPMCLTCTGVVLNSGHCGHFHSFHCLPAFRRLRGCIQSILCVLTTSTRGKFTSGGVLELYVVLLTWRLSRIYCMTMSHSSYETKPSQTCHCSGIVHAVAPGHETARCVLLSSSHISVGPLSKTTALGNQELVELIFNGFEMMMLRERDCLKKSGFFCSDMPNSPCPESRRYTPRVQPLHHAQNLYEPMGPWRPTLYPRPFA